MSLVEPDGVDHLDFPCFLNVFEKLDEEAEGEDGRQAPAEEKSRANAVAVAAVEPQADEEEHEIGNGFVELARMAGQEVAVAGEDEAVVGASVFANDFRVHEVAEADAAGCDGRGDGDVVEHAEDVYLRAAHIKPERNHQSERAAVGGQSSIARTLPAGASFSDRQKHFNGVAEEIARLVEQAVAEARTDEDADEAIEEKRVELALRDALCLIELIDDDIGRYQSDTPEEAVPMERETADGEHFLRWLPENGKYFHDVFLDLMSLREAGVYTLKRKCMMSPSCTTYSLPST